MSGLSGQNAGEEIDLISGQQDIDDEEDCPSDWHEAQCPRAMIAGDCPGDECDNIWHGKRCPECEAFIA